MCFFRDRVKLEKRYKNIFKAILVKVLEFLQYVNSINFVFSKFELDKNT